MRLHVGDHLPIESQFVALQLLDGQTIETNVRNLADYKPHESSDAVDVAKELAQARELGARTAAALESSRADVLRLQAELQAVQELLATSEARVSALEALQGATSRTAKTQRGRS